MQATGHEGATARTTPSGARTIEVEGLTFTYPGRDEPAIGDMTFSVSPGEIFGFLGPSGSGKSTTQKILNRLLTGYRGRIDVLGRNLGAWGPEYYEQVGVSFELPNHYLKLTARENLELFRSLYRGPTADPMELLERLGLGADADTRVGAFSKGMQMRLVFARAIINRPSLLFLDEPTSGLDPVNARNVRDCIREQADEGRTVFLTTHDMHLASELCDRVAFLVDGRIALTDSPRALAVGLGRGRVIVEYREAGLVASQEFPLDGLGEDQEFLRLIRDHPVERIHSSDATLEDIFIRVTGRELS
jgi:fluoroquinolone transport system ATP-binding protein